MGNHATSIRHENTARQIKKRVYFVGDTALTKGQGLCYQRDAVGSYAGQTATDPFQFRDNAVELPSYENSDAFAGVVVQSYSAVTGGQVVEIAEPGSIVEVALLSSTVLNSTVLTCSCGTGDAGYFHAAGHVGRGSAKMLQTKSGVVLSSNYTGAAALNSTGLIMTHSGATFVTDGVAVGDYLFLLGVEADGTHVGTPGKYEITAVAEETITISTAAATGGTMQVGGYVVVSGAPRAMAILLDGPESGLVQYVMPQGAGHASNATFSISRTGKTIFLGGHTPGTADQIATLADGELAGETKEFACLGTVTTNDIVVSLATQGFQKAYASLGARLDLVSLEFDAANERSFLIWDGSTWVEQNSVGAGHAAS